MNGARQRSSAVFGGRRLTLSNHTVPGNVESPDIFRHWPTEVSPSRKSGRAGSGTFVCCPVMGLLNVIDVEATCWDGQPPPGQVNEIIEIGLCVVDLDAHERVER